MKSVRKWDSIPVGNAVGKDNHYYVFVIYNNKFSDLSVFPEFYIVPLFLPPIFLIFFSLLLLMLSYH